jgi:hypothetical protein
MCGPKHPGGEELGFRMTTLACEFCGGLGIVEVEVANRYRRGEKLRRLRVNKWHLSQRQQAHILGISPMLFNEIEHGQAEWPAWVNQKLLAEYGYVWWTDRETPKIRLIGKGVAQTLNYLLEDQHNIEWLGVVARTKMRGILFFSPAIERDLVEELGALRYLEERIVHCHFDEYDDWGGADN